MIHKENCYCATCDNCKETYMDDHSGFSLYNSESELNEAMDNDDWYTGYTDPEHEGKHYCPKCFKQDPDIDDKIIVDLSRMVLLTTTPVADSRQEGEEVWAPHWEKINNELRHKGGVNPYAYRLGFLDALKQPAATPPGTKEAEVDIKDKIKEALENGIHASGRFTPSQCELFAEGLLAYVMEALPGEYLSPVAGRQEDTPNNIDR